MNHGDDTMINVANVGKTFINHPFGNGLYHHIPPIKMVICGLLLKTLRSQRDKSERTCEGQLHSSLHMARWQELQGGIRLPCMVLAQAAEWDAAAGSKIDREAMGSHGFLQF